MDLTLLQQLERAVRHTLNTALHQGASAEAPSLDPPVAGPRDLTAIVALTGEIEGRLSLRVSIDDARRLAELFNEIGHEPSADEVCDAIGELASMIAGRLGHESDRWVRCGCPQLLIGASPSLAAHGQAKRLAVPFACDLAVLHVDLAVMISARPVMSEVIP